jgi:hypothetical protein
VAKPSIGFISVRQDFAWTGRNEWRLVSRWNLHRMARGSDAAPEQEMRPFVRYGEGRNKEQAMRAWQYSIMVLAAVLAACGSSVTVDAVDEAPVSEAFTQADAAGSPGQASARDAPFAAPTVSLSKPLIGLWAVSSDVCQSPDGEGWIRITENLMTGYEVALRPIEIRSVGEHAWTIESEENYLGTQFAMVRQTLSLDGATLTVQPEGGQSEAYLRCGE